MSYHHITTYERGKIEELTKLGYSDRKIAKRIGRHHSSISREINRLAKQDYNAQTAHNDYESKRINSKSHGKSNKEITEQIKEKLLSTWSPEQIAHTVMLGKVSFKTIYNWIYKGKIKGITLSVLRRKGKKRSSQTYLHYAKGTPIRKRPKEVYSRKTFGHWELDTVVSSKGVRGCLATFAERKTRCYIALKMPNRTAKVMEKRIKSIYHALPKGAFKTATTDRGGEFACFDTIKSDLDLTLYFADPFCPHQRGTNEYHNGLLREFFPKGTDLGQISMQEIQHALDLINNRPRKCLGWLSPYQAFLHELSHLT
jgi:IS30 family transposase